jgi:predicted O-linked N-acetylglucosamine transferase (SPINDLY family)
MCEWQDLDNSREHFRELIRQGKTGTITPFSLLAMPGMAAAEHRACSELWLTEVLFLSSAERASSRAQFDSEDVELARTAVVTSPPARIRLGYLSSDFYNHATAWLLIEVLEAHDPERFELIAYVYGDGRCAQAASDQTGSDTHPESQRIEQRLADAFSRVVDIRLLTMQESAHAIHDDGIDILIDLKGFTRGSRTEILSFHPAPVQVNYLGYPGTLGGTLCDYIITDAYVTPPHSAADYSESFAYLPNSYQPHSRYSVIGPKPERVQAGLPEQGFVFCCFNQSYKITPEVFEVWCQLLRRCPGSVLWLLYDSMAEGNLRSMAMQRGIMPERLVFARPLDQEAHLGRLQLADLVLDTLPYNAHTTASDALWVGVPLVTCSGDTFASRVAGSVLQAIGLPELITPNLDAYCELAFNLASNPIQHQTLKARLLARRLTTPLFDVLAYTRDLESLYEQMWATHQAGHAPHAMSSGTADPLA